jgi:predicted ester cyclase
MVTDDDTVVVRWSMQGTHDGEFQGIAQAGAEVALGGTSILRVDDGKVVEEWVVYDRLSLLQQLGALPGAAADSNTGPPQVIYATCGPTP